MVWLRIALVVRRVNCWFELVLHFLSRGILAEPVRRLGAILAAVTKTELRPTGDRLAQ
jgi:hypothetical protein